MKSNFVIDKIPWLNKVPVLSLSLSVSVSLCLSLCLFVCVCVCVCMLASSPGIPLYPAAPCLVTQRFIFKMVYGKTQVTVPTKPPEDLTGDEAMCVYVCVSLTHARSCTHIYIHTRAHTHTHTHTHIHIHTHTHTHTVPSLTNRATFCRR